MLDNFFGRRIWLQWLSQKISHECTRARYRRETATCRVHSLVDNSNRSQSAIVRGAVLHRMGLEIVKERRMRASYGIDKAVPFELGTHPLPRMIVGPDGILRCSEVMHWYARKVFPILEMSLFQNERMPIGKVVQHTVYSQLTEWKFKFAASLNCSVELLVCDDDTPPEYLENCTFIGAKYLTVAVRPLCEIHANLRDLPPEAFEKNSGPEGVFYSIVYDLAIIFTPVIEFKLLYHGKEYGKASAKYV
jgi:hypothetical protein